MCRIWQCPKIQYTTPPSFHYHLFFDRKLIWQSIKIIMPGSTILYFPFWILTMSYQTPRSFLLSSWSTKVYFPSFDKTKLPILVFIRDIKSPRKTSCPVFNLLQSWRSNFFDPIKQEYTDSFYKNEIIFAEARCS